MRNYKSYTNLMQLAIKQMQGNTGTLIVALILQEMILLFVSSLASILVPGTDTASIIISYLISFILQLAAGIFEAGIALLCLHCACGMPCKINDLFYAFKKDTNKAIRIEFVLALIYCICTLPVNIYSYSVPSLTTNEEMLQYSLTMLSLMSVCMLVYSIITLPFFPVFYMMLDFPQCSVTELFRKSFKVMKGNVIRLLLLKLCFIPMMLLSMFTCGLALLWVMPFMNVTCTNFYLDLMTCQKNN